MAEDHSDFDISDLDSEVESDTSVVVHCDGDSEFESDFSEAEDNVSFNSPLDIVFSIIIDERNGGSDIPAEEEAEIWRGMNVLKEVANAIQHAGDEEEHLVYLGDPEELSADEFDGAELSKLDNVGKLDSAVPAQCPLKDDRMPSSSASEPPKEIQSAHMAQRTHRKENMVARLRNRAAREVSYAAERGQTFNVGMSNAHSSHCTPDVATSSSSSVPIQFTHGVRGLRLQRPSPKPVLNDADFRTLLGMDKSDHAAARNRRDCLVAARLEEERRKARECEKIFNDVMSNLRGRAAERTLPLPPPLACPVPHRSMSSIRRSGGSGATKKGHKVRLTPLAPGDKLPQHSTLNGTPR